MYSISALLLTSALYVVGGRRPHGKETWCIHCTGVVGVPHGRSGRVRKISRPPGLDPARSESLYRLGYPLCYISVNHRLFCYAVCYLYIQHVSATGAIIMYRHHMNRKSGKF